MENFEALNEQTNQEEPQNEMLCETEISDDDPLGVLSEEVPVPEQEKYTIKYNGKEQSMSLDELKTNAQKGMNYDHVKTEYEKLKNSATMKVISAMAKSKNMSCDEFVLSLAGQSEKNRIDELVGAGVSSDEAKRIAKLEAKERESIMAQEKDRPYMEFAKRFPNVNANDIDQSVWDEFDKTNDLIGAYMNFENRRLSEKIKMMEQNQINDKKRLGAANSGGSAVYDSFLEGLYS